MCFCLLGSIGTGKTTVLNELQRVRPDITVEEGFSRPVLKLQKQLKMSDYDAQLLINEFEIWGHLNRLPQKNLICTRSLLDTIIYCEMLNSSISLDSMIQIWERDYKLIEKFFYIPIEFDLIQDEIRSGIFNKELQKKIDERTLYYSDYYKLPIVTLTGSVENRVETLLKHL